LASGSTLPTGVTLTDNGNGTATLVGTSAVAAGVYHFSIEAANGVTPNAIQRFTLTINPSSTVTGPTVVGVNPSQGRPLSFVLVTGTGLFPNAPDARSAFGSIFGDLFCFWSCSAQATVDFGTTNAKILFDSNDEVGVIAPAGQGTVDVTVTVDGVTSQRSPADRFTYTPPPQCPVGFGWWSVQCFSNQLSDNGGSYGYSNGVG
jgi:hypothetical protein